MLVFMSTNTRNIGVFKIYIQYTVFKTVLYLPRCDAPEPTPAFCFCNNIQLFLASFLDLIGLNPLYINIIFHISIDQYFWRLLRI